MQAEGAELDYQASAPLPDCGCSSRQNDGSTQCHSLLLLVLRPLAYELNKVSRSQDHQQTTCYVMHSATTGAIGFRRRAPRDSPCSFVWPRMGIIGHLPVSRPETGRSRLVTSRTDVIGRPSHYALQSQMASHGPFSPGCHAGVPPF